MQLLKCEVVVIGEACIHWVSDNGSLGVLCGEHLGRAIVRCVVDYDSLEWWGVGVLCIECVEVGG